VADDVLAGTEELVRARRGCAAAHRRLFETLGRLDDERARTASRLQGWTVSHVLTHLARNAESHVRMLEGALLGQVLEQYERGHEQRSADIEAGASRPAAMLAEDVRSTALRLERTWDDMTPAAWRGHGLALGRPWPCADLPFHRWREVELHHLDLGLGYESADWPEEYVARELPRALAVLPDRIGDPRARRRLLAWLLGREEDPGRLEIDAWGARPDDYHAPP
jgi:maleylpyruvate isomerase